MKKKLICGIAAILTGAALSSCSSDNEKDSQVTLDTPVYAYNHVSRVDGTGSVSTGYGKYSFTTTMPANTIMVSAKNMNLPEVGVSTFKTDNATLLAQSFQYDGVQGESLLFSGLKSETGTPVSEMGGLLTQCVYGPGEAEVPGYKRLIPDDVTSHWAFITYKVGTALEVNTFWPDVTFCGATETMVPGEGINLSEDVRYRVVLQRDLNDALTGKADVIMYNAVFAPGMPEITIVLKDLAVQWTQNGYRIAGDDIVPFMLMDGALIQNPSKVLDSFKFDVTKGSFNGVKTGLVNGSASYTVDGKYQGMFGGKCVSTSL